MMNISSYVSEITCQFSQVSPASYPALVWSYYIKYLWGYAPDSWVARIAYSARILAILVSLPVVILGLLDIASYGIARTLGVIDDVKASTSDKATIHSLTPPTIEESDSAFSDSDRDSFTDHNLHNRLRSPLSESLSDLNHIPAQSSEFYAMENNLKLSGVGVFSPAASRPPSPTITRRHLAFEGQGILKEDEEGLTQLRHRRNEDTNADSPN